MRTIMLLGMAAGSLLLAGRASAEQPALDYGTPADADVRVYTGYPDRVPSEVDYRQVNGSYDAEGRWTGTWDGTYEAPDGRRYDGRYEHTVEGHGAGYPPPPAYDSAYHGGYDPRYDEDMERRCGRGGTVGGAVVGGVVGGIAGNRIAGRGNRTAGTLIGGGIGAIAGGAIGNASDKKKCEAWWSSRTQYQGGQGGYYQSGGYPGGYATTYQQGGYGYYTPGVVVTTIITTGAPVVTETVETSTRTYYENVPVRKRYVAKKRWKPKAKPRCAC
ncbi:MAG: glycine zipper 2TM domain-containing protein [Sphingopyxis sp.]|nr:glycine zipper 2TM domain-containing protein [Sphingopyxis sp.]